MFGSADFGDKSPSSLLTISKLSVMHWGNLSQMALQNTWLLVQKYLDHWSKESILQKKEFSNLAVRRTKLLTDILVTSRSSERKIMHLITIMSGPTVRIRRK